MPMSLDNQPKSPSNIIFKRIRDLTALQVSSQSKRARENKFLALPAPQPFQRPKTRRMLEERPHTSRESVNKFMGAPEVPLSERFQTIHPQQPIGVMERWSIADCSIPITPLLH